MLILRIVSIWTFLFGAITVRGHEHHQHQHAAHNHRTLQDRDNAELTERACGTPEPTEEEILTAIQVELEYFESLKKEQHREQNDDGSIPTPSPSPAVVADIVATPPTPGVRGLLLTNPFPDIPTDSGPTIPTPLRSTLPCPASTEVSYRIPTVYHVLSPTAGPSPATNNRTLQQQHAHLNNAFCRTGFSFDWINTTRTIHNDWYLDKDEHAMKSALRQGGRDTLNVYWNTAGGSLLGYAYFPTVSDIVLDGVTVNDGSMPGGTFINYNEGDTLVHEVGHWLGLFHTFQQGCSPVNDGIGDTPAELQANHGCPRYIPDSCTTSPGLDPINNFMDYSYDTCMFEFTPGQINRMVSQWNTYRQNTRSA